MKSSDIVTPEVLANLTLGGTPPSKHLTHELAVDEGWRTGFVWGMLVAVIITVIAVVMIHYVSPNPPATVAPAPQSAKIARLESQLAMAEVVMHQHAIIENTLADAVERRDRDLDHLTAILAARNRADADMVVFLDQGFADWLKQQREVDRILAGFVWNTFDPEPELLPPPHGDFIADLLDKRCDAEEWLALGCGGFHLHSARIIELLPPPHEDDN